MRRRFTEEQIIGILRAAQQRAKRGGWCVGEGDQAPSRDLGAELLSLWTALPLQVDVDLSGLVSCKHLSGVTRCDRGAQMGHPLTQASIAGRPQGPR